MRNTTICGCHTFKTTTELHDAYEELTRLSAKMIEQWDQEAADALKGILWSKRGTMQELS